MQVKEVLENKRRSGQPIGVGVNCKVADALKTMVSHDTGSCLVIDDAGKLKGMVTFREILQLLDKDPAGCIETPVAEMMDSDPRVATPDDTVDQIRNLMTTNHIRYLPVMSEGRLTDVISFYDVARAVAKQSDYENRMLKQYINDWPDD